MEKKLSKQELLTINKLQLLRMFTEMELWNILGYPTRTSNYRVPYKKVVDDLLHIWYQTSINEEVVSIIEKLIYQHNYAYVWRNFSQIADVIDFNNIKYLVGETGNRSYTVRSLRSDNLLHLFHKLGFSPIEDFWNGSRKVNFSDGPSVESFYYTFIPGNKFLVPFTKYLVDNKQNMLAIFEYDIDRKLLLFIRQHIGAGNHILVSHLKTALFRSIASLLLGRMVQLGDNQAVKDLNKLLLVTHTKK